MKPYGLFDHDLTCDYNRQLRAARTKRQLAWLGVILFMLLIGISNGVLLGAVSSPLFSALDGIVAVAGIWGGYHLLTRH